MQITLNGSDIDIPEGFTLYQLIEQQGLSGKRLAAEVNREIIPKAEHADFHLKSHDKVEIVHAIGGG